MNDASEEYARGFHVGRGWAEDDIANSMPASEWLETFREESRSEQRWARAFYLGALRGYREVTRTLKAGRWGT